MLLDHHFDSQYFRQSFDLRVAHHNPQRSPTSRHRDGVQLPDGEGAAAVGLHDLNLEVIIGTNLVRRSIGSQIRSDPIPTDGLERPPSHAERPIA
jgi:hypothetical protein